MLWWLLCGNFIHFIKTFVLLIGRIKLNKIYFLRSRRIILFTFCPGDIAKFNPLSLFICSINVPFLGEKIGIFDLPSFSNNNLFSYCVEEIEKF